MRATTSECDGGGASRSTIGSDRPGSGPTAIALRATAES
jgi:hypothetical protein